MNKILLLASSENTGYKLLTDELLTRPHLAYQSSLFSDLEFRFEGSEVEIMALGRSISDFDLVYIITAGKFQESLLTLSSYLNKHHIQVVDSIFSRGSYLEVYKLSQIDKLSSANLPCLRSFMGANPDSAVKFFNIQQSFKLVAKNSLLDHGEGVFLITNLEELTDYLKKGFLIQEYLPEKLDLRVIVVGQEALGCIHRIPAPGDFRANIGEGDTGARAEAYPLSQELSTLAVKASAAVGLDISGVDILVDQDDKKYILEVNHSPQYDTCPFFVNFMKLTGVNVTAKIADFLEEKIRDRGVI